MPTEGVAPGVAEMLDLPRDPFDRMLVAQAKAESLTLITRDPEIQKYDAEFMSC